MAGLLGCFIRSQSYSGETNEKETLKGTKTTIRRPRQEPQRTMFTTSATKKTATPSRAGISSAWPHNDGKGYNIQIETIPLDGKISLRAPTKKKSSGRIPLAPVPRWRWSTAHFASPFEL